MKKHTLIALTRLLFGLIGLAAIIIQLVQNIQQGLNIGNFFSFFTIESNMLAVALLLSIGIYGLLGKQEGKQIAFLRGAVTLYMTMTGVIYVLLLVNTPQMTIPWINTVWHYGMPIVILTDWLIFPPKQRISFTQALLWLMFPLAYMMYSIIRGTLTQWYPYSFIDPIVNGWPQVLVTNIVIGIGVIALSWLLTLRSASKPSI